MPSYKKDFYFTGFSPAKSCQIPVIRFQQPPNRRENYFGRRIPLAPNAAILPGGTSYAVYQIR